MKCPNCGFEIPEGHMYCDNCGTEINIVPDFDPEVENEINATLSGVADELNKDEKRRREKIRQRKKILRSLLRNWKLILGAAMAVILVAVGISVFFMYNNKTSLYYMGLAESEKAKGNTDKAIEYLIEGYNENPGSADILFRLSDYYLENGDEDKAVETLMMITDESRFSEDKVQSAYDGIISIYRQSGNTDKLSELLKTEDDYLSDLRTDYVPNMPSMNPAGGTYENVNISLKMTDGSDCKIYYTVNDGTPDTDSILYESEIVLYDEGEYNVKAVAINEFGISSVIAENDYIIEKGAPAAPEIMEASGEYNQNTMIVAVCEAGCTIFYTTDGSEPTMDSKQYISPIIMPVGTSHFRFIAYDNEGNFSEIVDRDYHLVFSRLVSAEQAVNSLVNTLVRLDILLDNTGKVRGLDGHNEYIYTSVIEVEGAGEYYMVVENHVSYDGVTTPTGLVYAVNTHDGTVNRLGYDSSGKYTLITISNR
jgi:uncharacterized Zn finger protein (UPF0148 family)